MKQTAWHIVRDDGVGGSNPSTPRPERIRTRTDTPDSPVVVARFWDKVGVGDPDRCWPWTGAIAGSGYGSFVFAGRSVSAHRFSYMLAHGSIPDGKLIRHKCDNRACVNPNHLEPGTHVENARDMLERGRHPKRDQSGGMNGHAKLNGEAVAKIKSLIAKGWTNKALGESFGVHHATISAIRTGKSWAA